MKTLLKLLAGVVLLVVIVLVVVSTIFDPNDYKAEIEELAREQASVELKINGDIGWSIFPTLGLELPQIDAKTLAGEPLASLQRAKLSVSVTALIAGELKMNGVLLDGLQLVIKAPIDQAGDVSQAVHGEMGKGDDDSGVSKGLKLDIGSVDIRNANIRYEDHKTGQKVVLSDFSFSGKNVASERAFPADMTFKLDLYQAAIQPELSVEAELQTVLYLDTVNSIFKATGLDLRLDAKGAAFGDKTVPMTLQGDVMANLPADQASVSSLQLGLANLLLKADVEVKQMAGEPILAGKVSLDAFDLNELLVALGQVAVETSDSNALKQIAMSATVAGPANTLGLKDLILQLDDTRFTGELSHNLSTGAQVVNLQGDKINVDRYLPPQTEPSQTEQSAASQSSSKRSTERYSKAPLFPLETVKGLNLKADLGLQQLQASGLHLSALKLLVTAKGGLINVSQVSADLYEGSFKNSATIDARKAPIRLNIKKNFSGVQLGGMLKDLTEKETFSGVFNMTGQYAATGNSVYDVVHSLDGNMKMSVKDGRLEGVNLVDQLCSGILKIQGKQADADAAASYTEFSNLGGSVKFVNGVADNRDLKAALVGVNLAGEGKIDLPKEALDYGLSLIILQELKGPNCQMDNKLHNLSLPLRCTGGFDDDPADMCGIDKAGMKKVLADLGAEEVKAKAKAEVESAKEKMESKIQDKLKGLFGR